MVKRVWILLAALAGAASAQEPAPPKAPGYLGVQIAPVEAGTRSTYGIAEGVTEGVVIVEAMADSPAAKAGLKAGDVLVRFAGEKVRTPEELVAAVRAHGAGEEVSYLLLRGDGRIDGKLRLAALPAAPAAPGAPTPPPTLEERLDRVQKGIEQLEKRVEAEEPRSIAEHLEAERRALRKAREEGNRDAIRRGEIRVQLLEELEVEGVRGLGERLDRIERKLDRILKRLGER
jgi:membrane-associated protease RseP (regulator of RpoE activity)